MAHPTPAVKFPEGAAWVVAQRDDPDSPIRVGCLVTVVVVPGMPLDPAQVDGQCAAVLGAFFDAGVRAVAVEDAEGPVGRCGILGPRSNAVLSARKARVLGVDHLGQIAQMRAIQQEAQQRQVEHQALFRAVGGCLHAAADRQPPGPFADLFRLRLRKDADQLEMAQEVEGLLAVERRIGGRPMAPDARRLFRGIALGDELQAGDVNAELAELKRRMRHHIEGGVLAADATTRLPNPDAKAAQPRRHQTGSGAVALSAAEMDLLRLCHEVVDGVEKRMLPTSLYELAARRTVRRGGADLTGAGQMIGEAVDNNLLLQHYIAETAQILGIDLDDYPTFRRLLEQSCLLEQAAAEGIYPKYKQAVEKAWDHVQSKAAGSRGEQELLAAVGKTTLLRRLASLEIVPEEYGDLSAELAECRLADVLDAAAAAGAPVDSGVRTAAGEFDPRRPRFLQFYDVARKRARRMAGQTVSLARKDGTQALLVCLGFHQPTVQAAWQAERVSFQVVLPDLSGRTPVPTSR